MDTIADAPLLLSNLDQHGVLVLTLNRPARRNSLNLALLHELDQALAHAAADAAVRAVVLAAAGPVFCSGHDLAEITLHRTDADGGEKFFRRAMEACARVMQAIVAQPQPVIAAVQGVATAAGCQLVAAADLAVAAHDSRFCTPGVSIGLFCATPAVALSRAVPRKPAMEMLLTGELIGAEEARRIGLVNRVVPREEVQEAAFSLARQIAGRSAYVVRIGKAAFNRQLGCDLDVAYRDAAAVMVENLMAEDAAEGISAFLGKRTPTWRDR